MKGKSLLMTMIAGLALALVLSAAASARAEDERPGKMEHQGMPMMGCPKMGGPGMMGGGPCPCRGDGPGPAMKRGKGRLMMEEEWDDFLGRKGMLKLTAEQEKGVRKILRDARKSALELRHRMGLLELELGELLDAEKIDLPAVKKQTEEIAKKKGELRYGWIEVREKIRGLLNPAQREMLDP